MASDKRILSQFLVTVMEGNGTFSTSKNQCYHDQGHCKTSFKAQGWPTLDILICVEAGEEEGVWEESEGEAISSALLFTISVIEGWLSWVSGMRVCLRHVGGEASWGTSPVESPPGRDVAR